MHFSANARQIDITHPEFAFFPIVAHLAEILGDDRHRQAKLDIVVDAQLDGVGKAISLKLYKKDAQHAVGARVGIKVATSSVTLCDEKGAAVAFEHREVGERAQAVA